MRYRKAVFIVTYRIKNEKLEYLLLKRKLHWKGWEFPKGGRKKLEPKKKAVKRELFEETGLKPLKGKIKKFNFKGKYDYHKPLKDRPGIKGQTFHLFSTQVKSDENKIILDPKEHSDFCWVSYTKAKKLLTWKNQKKALEIVNDWLKEKLH